MKLSISAAVIFSSPMVSTTRSPAVDPALLDEETCCSQAAGFGQLLNASAVAISNQKTNDRLFKVPPQSQEQIGQSHPSKAERRPALQVPAHPQH